MLLHMHVTSGEKAAASSVFLLPHPHASKEPQIYLILIKPYVSSLLFHETIANDWCM